MEHIQIESTIINRVAAGDRSAFEELYQLTYRALYAFLLSLTKNHDDAKDLLQETYVKVYSSAKLYKDQGNPMAWLMTIAKNQFLMKVRKEKHDHLAQSFPIVEKDLGFDTIEDTETRLLLESLFTHISDEERRIIILHLMIGLKHREIAKELGMPLGTVLSKYKRAISKLEHAAGIESEEEYES